jgi:hypothetical protein
MSDVLTVAGVDLDPIDLPSYDRNQLRPVAMAFDGQVGTGSVFIRDDDNLDTYSGRRITLTTDGTVLHDGFLGAQGQTRPTDDAIKRGNNYSWQDNNLLLSHIRIEYWDRPDELDTDRVLAAMAEFCPAVDTSSYVSTGITIGMVAKIYQDTTLDEVFADAMDQTAKTWFVDKGRNLHYHGLDEDVGFNASISITDSSPDGSTSFAPSNPTRQSDPYNLANDLKVIGSAGNSVIIQDTTSITRHDADDLVHQDTVNYPDSDDTGDLTAYGDAVLATRAEDRVTYHCDLAYITDPTIIEAGMRIQVQSEVFKLASPTWTRISQVSWQTVAPGVWTLTLDMSLPMRSPWELRHRRRSKKQNTSGDVGTTNGSPISIAARSAEHIVVPWTGTDSFAYSNPTTKLVGSYNQNWVTQADPDWPCSGLGIFYWTGRHDQAVWYEVDLSGIGSDVIGVLFQSTTGANPVDGSFGAGHACRSADDHPFKVGLGQPDPLDIDDYTVLGMINPFRAWQVFIPRSMFTADTYALVIAPDWQCGGSFCGSELVDNTRGPLIGGEGQTRRYSSNSDTSITCVPVSNQALAGKTQWVPPTDGLCDGFNQTFTLGDWNGVGVPECKLDGIVLNATDYEWDGGSQTVTINIAPGADSTVAFRYYRNA